MSESQEEELLTVQDAATRTGKSENGLRDAMRRGSLPYIVKFGRKLIRATDLEKYVETARRGRPKKDATD